jgi:hypothetical protein
VIDYSFPYLEVKSIAYAKMTSGLLAAIFAAFFLIKASIISSNYLIKLSIMSVASVIFAGFLDNYGSIVLGSLQPNTAGFITTLLWVGTLILIMWGLYLCAFRSTRDILTNFAKKALSAS